MSPLDRWLLRAATAPDAPAIETAAGVVWSNRGLRARAAALASELRSVGVRPGDRVGLHLGASAEYVAAILGTWWAGAAFVVIDPAWPEDRRRNVLRQAAPSALIGAPFDDVPCVPHDADPLQSEGMLVAPGACAAQSEAWVLFTSGSTGQPKGVRVSHAGLPTLVDAQIDAFGLRPGDRALFGLSIAFDASLSDLLTALTAGATLVMAPTGLLADPPSLRDFLATRRVTHADLPPALLARLDPASLPSTLRVVVVGGEASDPALLRVWAITRRVVSVYGPTEATVCTSMAIVDPVGWDRPSIGTPLPKVRYRVVDATGTAVPFGVPGELLIGGPAVALGYCGPSDGGAATRLPRALAERFFVEDDVRWYRTGDQVVAEPDGAYTWRGRLDRMVKVGGRLVEPGEVEVRLGSLPGVARCAVLPEGSPARRLVAYVVPTVPLEDVGRLPAQWDAALRALLPAFMVPGRIELRTSLPITASGKVELRSLTPPPEVVTPDPAEGPTAALCALWSRALGVRVGPHDDLTAAGRDSLSVLDVLAAAEAEGWGLGPGLASHGATVAEMVVTLSA